ncbi:MULTISPECIES: spermidine synthase [unclassified Bradyrhizobium]
MTINIRPTSLSQKVATIMIRTTTVCGASFMLARHLSKRCIAETANYGKTLFLDGIIQSAALDQELYHELLVQPAMLAHPTPKHVLVIGGGEGATIWQALRHKSVESLAMVDIDGELISICREHMTDWHRGAFEDPRCRIIFSDGRAFIENDQRLYDVVIIDLSDLVSDSPSLALYTREFYLRIKERLKPGGIVGVQALRFSFADGHSHAMLARTLKSVFNEVHTYSVLCSLILERLGISHRV